MLKYKKAKIFPKIFLFSKKKIIFFSRLVFIGRIIKLYSRNDFMQEMVYKFINVNFKCSIKRYGRKFKT